MRGGRYFTEFAIANDGQGGHFIHLGLIRPVSLTNGIDLDADWEGQVYPASVSSYKPTVAEKLSSQRTTKWKDSNIHCCTYYCVSGSCYWSDWNNEKDHYGWQGSECFRGSGTIGLLLDLNEGTLSVFKDGLRLGVMKNGLGGEYVWFASVYSASTISISKGEAPN